LARNLLVLSGEPVLQSGVAELVNGPDNTQYVATPSVF
jgi:hypothetical protein